ncbi:MAG: chalcone isomerase family protein [Myxococcota bacterium]
MRGIGRKTTILTVAVTLGLVLALPGTSLAGKKGGVTMPDQVTVAGKKLTLNGMGIREATIFNVDVYVAGLYIEEKTSSASKILGDTGPKKLVLHFVRDVDRDDITDAFEESFEEAAGSKHGALKGKLQKLNGWMSAIDEGQGMDFTFLPGDGVEVRVKGSKKGTIEGADFARAFLAIWLGSSPPNKGLKKGLLGK